MDVEVEQQVEETVSRWTDKVIGVVKLTNKKGSNFRHVFIPTIQIRHVLNFFIFCFIFFLFESWMRKFYIGSWRDSDFDSNFVRGQNHNFDFKIFQFDRKSFRFSSKWAGRVMKSTELIWILKIRKKWNRPAKQKKRRKTHQGE